jgi:hypothetical protein
MEVGKRKGILDTGQGSLPVVFPKKLKTFSMALLRELTQATLPFCKK